MDVNDVYCSWWVWQYKCNAAGGCGSTNVMQLVGVAV